MDTIEVSKGFHEFKWYSFVRKNIVIYICSLKRLPPEKQNPTFFFQKIIQNIIVLLFNLLEPTNWFKILYFPSMFM